MTIAKEKLNTIKKSNLRKQIKCDVSEEVYAEFNAWAKRAGRSNGSLCRAIVQYFLSVPDSVKKQILTHEIESIFEENSENS